jgi:hypothetical protein
MNYSDIKSIYKLVDDTSEARELIDGGESYHWRMIHEDQIDALMCEELAADEYVLGCFNASFLQGILGIPMGTIERMQAAECYEAVGMLIISMGKLEELQREYVEADGYGHHFAHYDFEEHMVGDYYLFKTN